MSITVYLSLVYMIYYNLDLFFRGLMEAYAYAWHENVFCVGAISVDGTSFFSFVNAERTKMHLFVTEWKTSKIRGKPCTEYKSNLLFVYIKWEKRPCHFSFTDHDANIPFVINIYVRKYINVSKLYCILPKRHEQYFPPLNCVKNWC